MMPDYLGIPIHMKLGQNTEIGDVTNRGDLAIINYDSIYMYTRYLKYMNIIYV